MYFLVVTMENKCYKTKSVVAAHLSANVCMV